MERRNHSSSKSVSSPPLTLSGPLKEFRSDQTLFSVFRDFLKSSTAIGPRRNLEFVNPKSASSPPLKLSLPFKEFRSDRALFSVFRDFLKSSTGAAIGSRRRLEFEFVNPNPKDGGAAGSSSSSSFRNSASGTAIGPRRLENPNHGETDVSTLSTELVDPNPKSNFVFIDALLKTYSPSVDLILEFLDMEEGLIMVQDGDLSAEGLLSKLHRITVTPVHCLGLPPPQNLAQKLLKQEWFFTPTPKIYTLVILDVLSSKSYVRYLEMNRGSDQPDIVFPYKSSMGYPSHQVVLLAFQQERTIVIPSRVHSWRISSGGRDLRSSFSIEVLQEKYLLTLVGHKAFYCC